MTQSTPEPSVLRGSRWARIKTRIGLVTCAAIVLAVAVVVAAMLSAAPGPPPRSTDPMRYLGLFEPHAPDSYAGVDQFAHSIGKQPNIVLYYNAWLAKFQVDFAISAAKRGAATLVQLGTGNTSLANIASGRYDSYWRSYADEVMAFGGQVILSFDHEMNGDWESWGYKHASPAAFIAAWQHVVTIFREQGARNVTWLWTVNIVDTQDNHVAQPALWWPGSSYVNWVGIDGYYYDQSETFSSLFGPTIADVRQLSRDPILIAETGAAFSAGQPAKIADLFAGVRTFGLLGFVLFDQDGVKPIQTWRINSPAAYAALRQGAMAYMKPPS